MLLQQEVETITKELRSQFDAELQDVTNSLTSRFERRIAELEDELVKQQTEFQNGVLQNQVRSKFTP